MGDREKNSHPGKLRNDGQSIQPFYYCDFLTLHIYYESLSGNNNNWRFFERRRYNRNYLR
jgi:hypothetical protein